MHKGLQISEVVVVKMRLKNLRGVSAIKKSQVYSKIRSAIKQSQKRCVQIRSAIKNLEVTKNISVSLIGIVYGYSGM